MISGKQFANQAKSTKYDGIKYSQYDCQAFVEKVLSDSGEKGHNWKGSNHMWRTALSWKGTLEECKAKFGTIPVGAWVFNLKYDGGEKARGYNDNEGNAYHVGIYLGDDNTRDSTKITGKRDGVGYRPLKEWNRVGLCKYLDYSETNKDNDSSKITEIIDVFRTLLDELERMLKK